MHFRCIFGISGYLASFIGAAMLIPTAVGFIYDEPDKVALLIASLGSMLIGGLLGRFLYDREVEFSFRDGFLIVFIGWFAMSLVSALPFYISGEIPTLTDAWFEAVSGITTTGATILTDVEGIHHGLLLWRSMIQWIGGMGIIVLSVALLPLLGVGGLQLYKTEVTGPTIDKIRPRVRDTASALWGVYLMLTVALALLLLAGGMPFFDSICHSLTTLATGGYSVKNTSIGAYGSSYINIVVTIFMFLAGINFTLHYRWIHGDYNSLLRSSELRWYTTILLIGILIVTISTRITSFDSWPAALEHSAFQVASILTTTGYGSYDYELWAPAVQFLLLVCMLIGGSAGSTSGGIKVVRVVLLLKNTVHEIKRILHPRAIVLLPFDRQTVGQDILNEIMAFVFLYLTIFLGGIFVLAVAGLDIISSIGATASALGNIGPGFGTVGPMGTYESLHPLSKITLSLCMIMGRLELFTILVVFYRGFWRS